MNDNGRGCRQVLGMDCMQARQLRSTGDDPESNGD